ncbi:MAG TPA: hypothetical protein VFB58_16580 [Chloroflexota bacterium]|nr:hypothetical protein [Chloroflexota bacterium]
MKKDYIITRQGKEFVLYEGLLDEAHQQGLKRITTTLIQIPHDDNGNVAVVAAEVETGKGSFSGIGDASPQNVNRMIVPHLIRMAETRAKARALRDAVNIGVTALEELGDVEEPEEVREPAAARESRGSYRAAEPARPDFPKASPYKPASANQLATIAKLSRLLGEPDAADESMTSAEASDRITELSRLYNERKGGEQRRSA